MKKYGVVFILFLSAYFSWAQDYLTGKMGDAKSPAVDIYYDRTQYNISSGIFMTVYKVLDEQKSLLYSFSVTHDKSKALFFISTKLRDESATAITVRYEKDRCGLIFNSLNNMDTVFNVVKQYTYLISFTDTTRDFPVLHKIKTTEGKEITLDPLSKIRIRKHKELVKRLSGKINWGQGTKTELQQSPQQIETFNASLFQTKDSFHARNSYYSAAIGRMRNQIDNDVTTLLKGKKVTEETSKYVGEKKHGSPEGIGLYISNGNYYDGNFSEGKFVSGTVILKNEAYEYCGGFNEGRKNGIGWLKYKNGNFDLGVFRNDALANGASLDNNPTKGETFFGSYQNGKRTGYGELRNQAGSKYCGEFAEGRLVKGYAKEVDPFGFTSYSLIDGAVKTPVDSLSSEKTLNALLEGN